MTKEPTISTLLTLLQLRIDLVVFEFHDVMTDYQLNRIREILGTLESRLSTRPAEFSREELEICASLEDVSYYENYYYPPAALSEAAERQLSFSTLREAAGAELRKRVASRPA
jgi:hypothetical protein